MEVKRDVPGQGVFKGRPVQHFPATFDLHYQHRCGGLIGLESRQFTQLTLVL